MMAFLGWLASTRIGQFIGKLGLVLLLIGAVYMRGRSAGKASAEADQRRKIRKAKERWDAIDADRPSPDAAIERLRERARRG